MNDKLMIKLELNRAVVQEIVDKAVEELKREFKKRGLDKSDEIIPDDSTQSVSTYPIMLIYNSGDK